MCSSGKCAVFDEDRLLARQENFFAHILNGANLARRQNQNIGMARNRRLDRNRIEFRMTHHGHNNPKPRPAWYDRMMTTGVCGYCYQRQQNIWLHLQTCDHEVYECCDRLFINVAQMNRHREDAPRCPHRRGFIDLWD